MRYIGFSCLAGLFCLFGFVPLVQAQSDDIQWWAIDTEHFELIFEDGLEEKAQEMALILEDIYDFWDINLGFIIPATFQYVLAKKFHPSVNPPFISKWQYEGRSSEGARVGHEWWNSRSPSFRDAILYHEYGHAVDIFKAEGVTQWLQNLFGSSVITVLHKSLAIIEGTAIYGEMIRTGHSRANDPRESMMMRQRVLDNDIFPLDQLLYQYQRTDWPPPYMMTHNVGPWLVRYISETYGTEAMLDILDRLAADPLHLLYFTLNAFGIFSLPISANWGSVLKPAIGVSGQEFHQGFSDWLNLQFEEQINQIQTEGVTESQKISPLTHWVNKPAWSPTGEWIVFLQTDDIRTTQLRLIRSDGSEDHSVVTTGSNGTVRSPLAFSAKPAWAPDGESFIYVYNDFRGEENFTNVFEYNLQMGKSKRLTEGVLAYNAIYTPDGQSIVFAANEEPDESPNLFRLDLETNETSLIKEMPEHLLLDSWTVSPDGTQLTLSIWALGGYQDLYMMPIEGGELTPITQDLASDFNPTWTSDGEYVLYSSDGDGVNNIYAYRPSDNSFFKVTNVISGAYHPTVSPDLDQIAFVGFGSQGYELRTMNYDPSEWKSIPPPSQTPIPVYQREKANLPVRAYNNNNWWVPDGWLPSFIGNQVSASFGSKNALSQYNYSLNIGYDLTQSKPFYNLSMDTVQGFSPMTTTVSIGESAFGSQQRISFSKTLPGEQALSHSFNFSLSRMSFSGMERFSIAPRWGGSYSSSRDLLRQRTRWNINNSHNFIPNEDLWQHQAIIDLQHDIRIPIETTTALSLNLVAGLAEGGPPSFRVGGRFGPFAVRGQQPGSGMGHQALVAGAEFRFPLWSLNREIFWPVFVQGMNGKVFAEAGFAGSPLTFDQPIIGYGGELELALSLSYNVQFSLKVGATQALDGESPEFYFDFGFPGSIF